MDQVERLALGTGNVTLSANSLALLRVSRSRKRVTVFEDHCPPVALLIPRRFSSAAICRADGKLASSA